MSLFKFLSPSIACILLLFGCEHQPDFGSELEQIDAELEELPKNRPNLLIPTVGFGSAMVKSAEEEVWIDIILPETRSFDTIVLVPALINDLNGKLGTLGFPRRFKIETFKEESPSSQHVQLGSDGWIYQSLGKYDPTQMPDKLEYQFDVQQSNSVPEAGPATVSLYYARSQAPPVIHHDIRTDPNFVLVGGHRTHPTWAAQSKATGEHRAFQMGSSISLSEVPAGAELFLRIANHEPRTNVAIDNVQLSPPFRLKNGDFEFPQMPPRKARQQVYAWHYNATKHTNVHCGLYWSTGNVSAPELLIDHTEADFPNPGFAPVVFKVPEGTTAKKVRLTATLLQPEVSWRVDQSGHNLAMNEIFLFDGQENISLHCTSSVSNHSNAPLMFYPSFALDGYSYHPPLDPRKVTRPGVEIIDPDLFPKSIGFDLGEVKAFEQLRLYPVDRSPQFEHIHALGVGFPSKIGLYVGDTPERERARRVLQTEHKIPTGGHPVSIKVHPTEARYVWVELSDGLRDPRSGSDALGVAEIELIHHGSNILQSVPPTIDGEERKRFRYLSDGMSSHGTITSQKEWLIMLHHRAQLEREKEQLLADQSAWNARQERFNFYLKIAVTLAILAAILVGVFTRLRHQQNLRDLRDKIGANLHDEVGANLSSIAITSEMLGQQLRPEKRQELISDITRVAQETSNEVRLLTRFLENQGSETKLIDQFRRIERQMLPGIKSISSYDALDRFDQLIPIEKWGLILFFKEALHNIVKHANASEVSIRSFAEKSTLVLEVTDNGSGIPSGKEAPTHLVKRAKSLHGKLHISSPEQGGTTLRLTLSKKRKNYS